MNSIFKLAMLASLGALAPFLSQQSRAADAAQPSDDALTTIIVTRKRKKKKLKDVPMSITALGGGSLDNLQYRSFSDYAAMVPGLSLTSSQPGLTNLTLRGQMPAASDPRSRCTWTNRPSVPAAPCSTVPS